MNQCVNDSYLGGNGSSYSFSMFAILQWYYYLYIFIADRPVDGDQLIIWKGSMKL